MHGNYSILDQLPTAPPILLLHQRLEGSGFNGLIIFSEDNIL